MHKTHFNQFSSHPVTNSRPPRQDQELAYLNFQPFLAILLLVRRIAVNRIRPISIKVCKLNFQFQTKPALVWTSSSLRARYVNSRYTLRSKCFCRFRKLDLVFHSLILTGRNRNYKNKIKLKRVKKVKWKISWLSRFLLTTYLKAEYETKMLDEGFVSLRIILFNIYLIWSYFINSPHLFL